MKRNNFVIIMLCLSIFITGGLDPASAALVNEGGVIIDVGRVLHGASSGTRYYGYTGGMLTLPHNRGGMFTFSLWNDMEVHGHARYNIFNAEIGGAKIRIPFYATRNQMTEEYTEFRGSWGPAGAYTVTMAVPPGVQSFTFNNGGSETGIELSNLSFADGYRPLSGGYELKAVRPFGEPVVRAGRTLNGAKTGRKYYGYTDGSIYAPHIGGGFLSFKLWNDQHTGVSSALNKINLKAGPRQETFTQYTTSLDLQEEYKEFINQWGPGGGGDVIIQIPENIYRVDFNNGGSETGIEISDVAFSQGMPIVFQFKERINTTSQVLNSFGRTLHGSDTGRIFYGYTAGSIIMPHNRGGVLTFRLWNDHHVNTALTANQAVISAGTQKITVKHDTLQNQRPEFYKEFMNVWGPAGGKEVSVTVPAGVTRIDINNSGSQTGIELSDLLFRGN